MSVLMLTNENPEENRVFIRDYILDKYISNMDSVIQSVEKDNASYSQPDEYSKLVAVRDRNYDELLPLDDMEDPDSLNTDANTGVAGRDLDDDIL